MDIFSGTLGEGHTQPGARSIESSEQNLERARLIASIYEVVLHPEHFDDFMLDWSSFVDQAARRLGELHVSEGRASRLLDDPTIEAHFKRAFALFERMGRGEIGVEPDLDARPVLLRLGLGGQLQDVTPQATALFGANPSLGKIADALEPDSATRLWAFLKSFERGPASGRFAILSLAWNSAQSGTDHVAGMPGGGLIAVTTCRAPGGDGYVTELRPLEIGWSDGLSTILVDTFRLTPREIEVIRELSMGGDLGAVSQRVGRSLNTLRAQIKSVFAKTRTHSQSELMRLVAALVLHGPLPQPPSVEPDNDGHEVRIDLGDGQFMPVHTVGPVDGLPVVFVHGMLEGLGVLTHIGPALHAAGLRFIAPVRKNYGQAMVDHRIKDAPDNFARDLGIALEKLGISRCIMLGHMAGGVYAYAAAQRLQSVVAGVINISGGVPIKSIEQFASMMPRQRAIAYTARFAPALLPAVLRAGIARIDSTDAERFMTALYPKATHDRGVVADSAIANTLLEGYRFTVAQGPYAFQMDSWHVTRNWSALVAKSGCPIALVHGEFDPVVSVESVRDFADCNPRIALQEIAGAGQLIFYSCPETVITALAKFARDCLGGVADR